MKNYRLIPLLTALWLLIASFSTFLAYFGTSVNPANTTPVVSTATNVASPNPTDDAQKTVTVARVGDDSPTPVATAEQASLICEGYYAYISIGNKNICLKSTQYTGGDLSYTHGYIFNSATYESHDSFIFAHNSSALFGGLKNLGAGTSFSVTVGDQTAHYEISEKILYCDYSNAKYPCSNYSEPVLDMQSVIWPRLKGADLSLMTCAGSSIGNGDATHRLIVFAKRI